MTIRSWRRSCRGRVVTSLLFFSPWSFRLAISSWQMASSSLNLSSSSTACGAEPWNTLQGPQREERNFPWCDTKCTHVLACREQEQLRCWSGNQTMNQTAWFSCGCYPRCGVGCNSRKRSQLSLSRTWGLENIHEWDDSKALECWPYSECLLLKSQLICT